jgi:hypothetical protein
MLAAASRTPARSEAPISMPVRNTALAATLALILTLVAGHAAERLRFWNLTTVTIQELYLAPAGTTQWSGNQCANDRDGAVDADERLTITGVSPGRYDVKLKDKKGRTCVVAGVELVSGKPYAFSLSDKDLTNCTN